LSDLGCLSKSTGESGYLACEESRAEAKELLGFPSRLYRRRCIPIIAMEVLAKPSCTSKMCIVSSNQGPCPRVVRRFLIISLFIRTHTLEYCTCPSRGFYKHPVCTSTCGSFCHVQVASKLGYTKPGNVLHEVFNIYLFTGITCMHLYLSDINITWSTVHARLEDYTSIFFLKQGTSTYRNFSHFMYCIYIYI
jgi:hypothetical protein